VHACAGIIVPMCAYTCRNNGAYVAGRLVGMKILGADKTRPNAINERLDTHRSRLGARSAKCTPHKKMDVACKVR
jgi:hypothetical protein